MEYLRDVSEEFYNIACKSGEHYVSGVGATCFLVVYTSFCGWRTARGELWVENCVCALINRVFGYY